MDFKLPNYAQYTSTTHIYSVSMQYTNITYVLSFMPAFILYFGIKYVDQY